MNKDKCFACDEPVIYISHRGLYFSEKQAIPTEDYIVPIGKADVKREGNDVTVESATKVSWVNLRSRADTAYIYKDKGAGHFDDDFNHKFLIWFDNRRTIRNF